MPSYMEGDIEEAISSILKGSTIRKASRDFGIPCQTLNSRIQGHETRASVQEINQKLSSI